jgi:hypothetical protein
MEKNLAGAATPTSSHPASLATAVGRAAGDLGVMFFLLRMAFWLGLVLILLPSGSSQQPQGGQVAASDAISAASATVGDLRQFCARQPDACTVGSHVASQLGSRAQAGARMLYEFVTGSMKGKDGANTSSARPVKPADGAMADKDSQNTLTPADLAAPWHGPQPHKEPKHAA